MNNKHKQPEMNELLFWAILIAIILGSYLITSTIAIIIQIFGDGPVRFPAILDFDSGYFGLFLLFIGILSIIVFRITNNKKTWSIWGLRFFIYTMKLICFSRKSIYRDGVSFVFVERDRNLHSCLQSRRLFASFCSISFDAWDRGLDGIRDGVWQ